MRSQARKLVLLVCVLTAVGCEKAEVETLSPKVGRIVESFTEPAKTRLAKTWRITMPVAGRIARIGLEPGDPVAKDKELVAFDTLPLEKNVEEAEAFVKELEAELKVKDNNQLEMLAKKEAQATVRASDEALKASDAEVKAEKARSDRAAIELARKHKLHKSGTLSDSALDDAELAAETALIELRKQEFYLAALRAIMIAVNLGPRAVEEYLGRKGQERGAIVQKLIQAKARLARARHDLKLASVRSPIDGVVLQRHEQGDGALPEGTDLLLLGNLDELEVEADVLTQDALRLAERSVVWLQPAAGHQEIGGKVKRIEPAGFTKLSSLGVEQQRVKVIVSLDERPKGLKVGYRLQARFITGTKDDALIVPRFSVLQAPDRSFYVYKVAEGRLAKQAVSIGLRSDLELEVVEGLTKDDAIVARPDTTLKDGQKVKATGESDGAK